MVEDNPYKSPNGTLEKTRDKKQPIQYKNRKEAFFANFIRGAKLSAIWSFVVNSIMFLSFSIYLLFKILYREIWEGIDMRWFLRDSEVQAGLLRMIIVVVFSPLIYSLLGGLCMGFVHGIFRKHLKYDEENTFIKV
jgi:hypothetical protein